MHSRNAFSQCNSMECIKNLLTMTAKISAFDENNDISTTIWDIMQYRTTPTPTQTTKFTDVNKELLYIILDLQDFSNKTIFQASHSAISVRQPNTYDSDMISAITTAARTPPSHKQPTRLSVRAEMKDVTIIEDSYKLPLPTCLQDYVSLRNLEATIRSHYIVEKLLYCNFNLTLKQCCSTHSCIGQYFFSSICCI